MKKLISTFLVALFIAPLAYAQEAGKILFVYGKAEIVRDKSTLVAKRGALIQAGDIVKTAKASTAQIKLSDGTLVALKPSSEWNLQEYIYNKQNPGLGKQSSELLKGGLRAVTGYIGKADPKKVKYTAGTTTIGIRGTTFEAEKIDSGADAGVYVRVETGQVLVSNQFGSVNLYANEAAKVAPNQAPVATENTQVFTKVEEDIKADQPQEQGQKTTLKSTENTSQAQDALNASQANLNASQAGTNAEVTQQTNPQVEQNIGASSDKLEEKLKYLQLAQELEGYITNPYKSKIYLNKPNNTNNAGNNAEYDQSSVIIFTPELVKFITSKGEFKGKGYKELKAAYNNLSSAKKAELEQLHQSFKKDDDFEPDSLKQNPLKYIEDALTFTENKVQIINGGKSFQFSKENTQGSTNTQIERNGNNSFAKIGNPDYLKFTMPTGVYTYKLDRNNTKIGPTSSGESEVDFSGNDISESFLKIDFTNKKFIDALLEFKTTVAKYTFSGVKDTSFILDSGSFLLDFAKTITQHNIGNQNDTYYDKTAQIMGNFYTSKNLAAHPPTTTPTASGVFGADISSKLFLGYVTFTKN